MKKILKSGGRRITLYTDETLEQWLEQIPQAWKPKRATFDDCYSLMVLLWYTGARPSELAQIKKEDIYPLMEAKGLAITLRTLKGGEDYRKISMPLNKITLKMYQHVQNSSPEGYYLHYFRCAGGTSKLNQTWTNTKTIYIRNQEGQPIPETYTETKHKEYFMHNKKIYRFVNSLTGLPPLYFRHHRLSWMAKLGATMLQMQEFKGSKDFKSVTPYLQLGAAAEKEFLNFFPK